MSDIDPLPELGLRFLFELYQKTDGRTRTAVGSNEILDEARFESFQPKSRIPESLQAQGLIEYDPADGYVSLTQKGVDLFQAALADPERPIENFPPLNTIATRRAIDAFRARLFEPQTKARPQRKASARPNVAQQAEAPDLEELLSSLESESNIPGETVSPSPNQMAQQRPIPNVPPPIQQKAAVDVESPEPADEEPPPAETETPAPAETETPAPQERVVSFAVNDRPEGPDRLRYEDYAAAFARVLGNPDTKTPLTIGIYGSWGMGKSFLMGKIEEQLRAVAEAAAPAQPPTRLQRLLFWRRPKKPDYIFIRFNAWVYSGSDNLWAALITRLYDSVEHYFGPRQAAYFRLGKNFRRSLSKTLSTLILVGIPAVILSLLLNFQEIQAAWGSTREAWGAIRDSLSGSLLLAAPLLAALPSLLRALRELFAGLAFTRSEQLAALSSRRDFRDKIGFMNDIKQEIAEIKALLAHSRPAGPPPRVVIFIDDLDRCPPAKAVEVLEAIMLLLADDDKAPFIIFLGIDARVVVKAIEERYGRVLVEAGITGYEYLDKIVQIPFRIPPADPDALTNYVQSLLYRSEEELKEARAVRLEPGAGAPDAAVLEADGDELEARLEEARLKVAALQDSAAVQELTQQLDQAEDALDQDPPDTERAAAALASAEARLKPPAPRPNLLASLFPFTGPSAEASAPAAAPVEKEIAIRPEERQAFERFAREGWLSHNPRRVKRIVNIYRIVRSLAGPNDSGPEQWEKRIKWVVLSEQWPFRTAWIMQHVEDEEQKRQAQSPEAGPAVAPETSLAEIYQLVRARVEAKDSQPFAALDGDPELFDSFIADWAAPRLTAADVTAMRPFTFNLNPALQGEVIKAVGRRSDSRPQPSQLQLTPALEDELRALLQRLPNGGEQKAESGEP